MQRWTIFMTGFLIAGGAGCESWQVEERTVNVEIAQSIEDMAIRNAIITQQTLYPYHFVVNGSSLNALGECELKVLASHYREHPGTLNVRKGAVPDALYGERVQRVHDTLAQAGVNTDRIQIADGMPGGDGMSSQQVIMIIDGRNSPSQPQYYGGGGGAQDSAGLVSDMLGSSAGGR